MPNFTKNGEKINITPFTGVTSHALAKQEPQSSLKLTGKADPSSGLWIRAAKAVVYAGKHISDAAKILFIVIRDYQGENPYAWASVETLATDTDKTPRRVQQLIRELEEAGAIEVVERPGRVSHYRTRFLELKSYQHQEATTLEAKDQLKPFVEIVPGRDGSIEGQRILSNKADIRGRRKKQEKMVYLQECESKRYQQLKIEWETNSNKTTSASVSNIIQEDTPMNHISPVVAKNISPELESTKLKLCEESRTISKKLSLRKNTGSDISAQVGNNNARSCNKNPGTPQVSALDAQQLEIRDLLISAGLACKDAEKVAISNRHQLPDLLKWLQIAQKKNNPGGYLKVMLLEKSDVKPPTANLQSSSENGISSTISSKPRSSYAPWKHQSYRSYNLEAPAMAYIRRHEKEAFSSREVRPNSNESGITIALQVDLPSKNNSTGGVLAGITTGDTTKSRSKTSPYPGLPQNSVTSIDPNLRMHIRQLDKFASQNLKQARIENNTVIVEFWKGYVPPNNLEKNWLPVFKSLNTYITRIVVV